MKNIEKIAALLEQAYEDTAYEYTTLIQDMKLSASDEQAATAVYRGELDARLFADDMPTHIILSLDKTDQQRLMSSERLRLRNHKNEVYQKRWIDMTRAEKFQLLGIYDGRTKKGRILSTRDQRNGDNRTVVPPKVDKPKVVEQPDSLEKRLEGLSTQQLRDLSDIIIDRVRGIHTNKAN